MSKNIQIRAVEPSDLDKIAELFRTRVELDQEGAERRRLFFEWIAFHNPFANGKPTYFVAEDRGRIVAHLGRMPCEFILNGKVQKGYFTHDLYVHPEYRQKGFGLFLSMSLYKAVEESSDSFCCMVWTSELNLEFQRRRGYKELWTDRYVKILNPYEKLLKLVRKKLVAKALSPILKIAFLVADYVLLSPIPRQVNFSKIAQFDSRFDILNQKMMEYSGISPNRQSDYLKWRFMDRPFKNSEVFAAGVNGQILGFMVLGIQRRTEYPRGIIVDLVANPSDITVVSSMLKVAVEYFRKEKVHSIVCCLSDERFAKVFRRLLFMRRTSKEPLMLSNLEKCGEKEYLLDIRNWHLTYAASDGFMFDT